MGSLLVLVSAVILLGWVVAGWSGWFLSGSPARRLETEARRRRWHFKKDRDGLGFALRGETSGRSWDVAWNARGSKPVLDFVVADGSATDWLFILRRPNAVLPVHSPMARVFTGKDQPAWGLAYAEAHEVRTDIPEVDENYIVLAVRDGRSGLRLDLVRFFSALPPSLQDHSLVIAGLGRLQVHVQDLKPSDQVATVRRLGETACSLPALG